MTGMELGLEKPDPKRALISALTIGGAYIVSNSKFGLRERRFPT